MQWFINTNTSSGKTTSFEIGTTTVFYDQQNYYIFQPFRKCKKFICRRDNSVYQPTFVHILYIVYRLSLQCLSLCLCSHSLCKTPVYPSSCLSILLSIFQSVYLASVSFYVFLTLSLPLLSPLLRPSLSSSTSFPAFLVELLYSTLHN